MTDRNTFEQTYKDPKEAPSLLEALLARFRYVDATYNTREGHFVFGGQLAQSMPSIRLYIMPTADAQIDEGVMDIFTFDLLPSSVRDLLGRLTQNETYIHKGAKDQTSETRVEIKKNLLHFKFNYQHKPGSWFDCSLDEESSVQLVKWFAHYSESPRNASCPCNSGVKFKRCCYRLALAKQDVDKMLSLSRTVPRELKFIDDIPGGNFEEYLAAAMADNLTLENSDFWRNLGTDVGILGFNEEAIRCFRKTTDIDPNDHGARLNLAAILSNIHEHDEALSHIEKVPDDTKRRSVILANTLAGQGNDFEAIPYYERAILEEPEFALPYQRLLDILENNGHPSYEYWVDQSARMIPTSPWVAYFWARNRWGDGKIEELANADWFDNLRIEVDDTLIGRPDYAFEVERAQLLRQIAVAIVDPNSELIESLANQIDSFEPNLHLCDEGKALALLCANQGFVEFIPSLYDRVCEDCIERRVGGFPQSVNTLLAVGHLWKGDYERTIEYAEKVIKENPQADEVLHVYYWALDEVGRTEDAITNAKRIYQIRDDIPHIAHNLGLMCSKTGMLGAAQYYWERQLDLGPHIFSQKGLAFLYLLQQQPELAEETFQKYSEMVRDRKIARGSGFQPEIEYVSPWSEEDYENEEVREAVGKAEALEFSDDDWESLVTPILEEKKQGFDILVEFSQANKNSPTFASDLIELNQSFGEGSFGAETTIKPEAYSMTQVLESVGHGNSEALYQARFQTRLEELSDYSVFSGSLKQELPKFDELPFKARTSLLEGERRYLSDAPMLDYSPVVVSFAKSLEISLLEQIYHPYKKRCEVEINIVNEIEFSQHKKGSQATTLFHFLEKGHHFELGSMAHVFRLCMGRTAEKEILVGRLRDFIVQELDCEKFLTKLTVESIVSVADKYRNPGAHSKILTQKDVVECRSLCLGVLNSLLE